MPGLLVLRRQRGLVPRARAREPFRTGSWSGRRPLRELARSAGWTVFGSTRAGDRSAIVVLERQGVDPERARPRAAPARGRRVVPAGAAARQPALLQ